MTFDREAFVKTFQDILGLQRIFDIEILCQECQETDNFLLYFRDEEYYIIHFDSGIIINWYKHLGRCNNVNKNDFTFDDLKDILTKLKEDLEEYFKEVQENE